MRIFLSTIAVVILSCGPVNKDPEVKNLYDEVMQVHDEVMPETSTIHKLKKQIRNLNNQDSISYVLLKQLDDADESMMQWMSDFGAYKKLNDASKEDKLNYLNEELIKISEVSNKMKDAISDSKTYLETLENE